MKSVGALRRTRRCQREHRVCQCHSRRILQCRSAQASDKGRTAFGVLLSVLALRYCEARFSSLGLLKGCAGVLRSTTGALLATFLATFWAGLSADTEEAQSNALTKVRKNFILQTVDRAMLGSWRRYTTKHGRPQLLVPRPHEQDDAKKPYREP